MVTPPETDSFKASSKTLIPSKLLSQGRIRPLMEFVSSPPVQTVVVNHHWHMNSMEPASITFQFRNSIDTNMRMNVKDTYNTSSAIA